LTVFRTSVGIVVLSLVLQLSGAVLAENESLQRQAEGVIVLTKPSEGLRSVFAERVIDGDTIITDGGERIRYIGMDTPETVHPSKPVGYLGHEASDRNKELVEGKTVDLEFDIERMDHYGRTLAYVWSGDEMINAILLREGYAQIYTYPPNVKYIDYFTSLQEEARTSERGLWAVEEKEIVFSLLHEQDAETILTNKYLWLWKTLVIGLIALLLYKWSGSKRT